MARPYIDIDWKLVEKLMESACTGLEIAGRMRMNKNTFYNRFKDKYGVSFQDYNVPIEAAGAAMLKLMMHSKALNNQAPGNVQMLIFLAKTRLGMRELEIANILAPNQDQIDKEHKIMQLEHRIKELENNANEY